jgi:TolB-like protein
VYKGKAVDIRKIGKELGVGYVVEGSVRKQSSPSSLTRRTESTSGLSGLTGWARTRGHFRTKSPP